MNERNQRSGEHRSGEYDPQLELLRQIDSKVTTLAADSAREFKDVNARLGAGEVRFARIDGRMDLLEAEQRNCAAMVETSVRKVLKEQKETDRIERSRHATHDDTDDREPEKERLSVGAMLKLVGAIAAAVALIIGAYVAGQSKPQPNQTAAQQGGGQ